MKRYLISTVVVLVVALVAFGQQVEWRQHIAQWRQAQTKAIETIQEQAGKLKVALEESTRGSESFGRWELSEEEKTKLRESFTKMQKERQQALGVIEQQIMRLKGRRPLDREHEESIAELQTIQALATTEKAEKTAKRLEELIAKRNKEHEDTMQKLGLERLGGRR